MFTTRRGFLAGAAVLAAAGCTHETAKITISDADLTAALHTARSLAQAAQSLGYTDMSEDHLTHVATLERLLLPNVVVEDDPSEVPDEAAALAEAEAAGSEEAAESCLTTEGDYAVLFGEIAACRAAHAAVIA